MKKIITTLILAAVFSTALHAQDNGQIAAMRNKVSDGYNFWLYAPNEYYEFNDELFPVVIFLHGRSLCGNDMNRSRKYGVINALEMGLHIEALAIAPQNPGGSWNPQKVNQVLDWVLNNYRADPCKVYVIGMSLGGYGTMDFVGTYPDKVAAAMALCGGCSLRDVQELGSLPLWIMHGTADSAVSISESKKVVNALKDANNDHLLRYDWLQGASHGDLSRIFYLPQTYEWFFEHDKQRNPNHVNRRISITKSDMNDVYRGLNTHGGKVNIVNRLDP